MESDRRLKTVSAADAAIWAAPTDVAAERIDPDVIVALARWRHVDPHSLSGVSSVLTTHTGLFAGDSAGYLSALHGFVAEQISYDALSSTKDVVMPDATTVPAWDLLVDGRAVQIKEGVTADAAVHHALERYPQYREFITDPAAAARLRAEGIDAQGVSGLEPSQIAEHTANSLEGLRELDISGALHIPVLTAIFATFRYWERVDEGRLDVGTALQRGATDTAAQSIGAALGVKLAAIMVVASGMYAVAALPLTIGALGGAAWLRVMIEDRRRAPLREALDTLRRTEWAAERAATILIDASRKSLMAFALEHDVRLEDELSRIARVPVAAAQLAFSESLGDLERLGRMAQTLLRFGNRRFSDSNRVRLNRNLRDALGEADFERRARALSFVVGEIAQADDEGEYRRAVRAAAELLQLRWNGARREREHAARKAREACDRAGSLWRAHTTSHYALLIEQFLGPARDVAQRLSDVQKRMSALGVYPEVSRKITS